MQAYIGAKIILAEPMGKNDFDVKFKGAEAVAPDQVQHAGYHGQYPPMEEGGNVYDFWSPKDVFENAYRLLLAGEIDASRRN